MKIFSKEKNNIIECECGMELEYTKEDVETGEYGCAYVTCPECFSQIWLENEDGKTLRVGNIEYPKDFAHFENGKQLSNSQIQEYINECLKSVEKSDKDYGVYSLRASGDTFVIVIKYEDEYSVYVCKDYYESAISR